ncbi:TPA: hypothetical protein ACGO33_001504, partial [Streptococcus suis]
MFGSLVAFRFTGFATSEVIAEAEVLADIDADVLALVEALVLADSDALTEAEVLMDSDTDFISIDGNEWDVPPAFEVIMLELALVEADVLALVDADVLALV